MTVDSEIIDMAKQAVANSDPSHPTKEQMLLLKYSLKALLEVIDNS